MAEPAAPVTSDQPRTGVRLPLASPRVTYVLLAAIVVVFGAETVLGGSTSTATLQRLGGQVNSLVAGGEWWRLLACMFLHIGPMHLAFNGWALFSLGREVEAFYGAWRFTLIYFVAGLAGGIAYLLLGPDIISAGASGAVFGLIGAEIAFFLRNRRLFGSLGRQRLGNLAGLVGVNLVLGFTIPGVNNVAHLGGLVGGMLIGLALSPRYLVEWSWTSLGPEPRLSDQSARWLRGVAIAAAVLILLIGAWLGLQRWEGSSALLNQKADAAIEAGEWSVAQQLLEEAIAADPDDARSYFRLGVVLERRGDAAAAITAFEEVTRLAPEFEGSYYNLGVLYSRQEDWPKATDSFQRAAQIAPGSADVLYQLGIAYTRQGRTPEAVVALEGALEDSPEDPEVLYALGQLYARLGRTQEARGALQSYLRLTPSGEGAESARSLLSSLPTIP